MPLSGANMRDARVVSPVRTCVHGKPIVRIFVEPVAVLESSVVRRAPMQRVPDCISSSDIPSAFMNTASGFPPKGALAKTSSVVNRYSLMVGEEEGGPLLTRKIVTQQRTEMRSHPTVLPHRASE